MLVRSRSNYLNYFSSIAIELLLQDGQRKFSDFLVRSRSIEIKLLCSRRITRPKFVFSMSVKCNQWTLQEKKKMNFRNVAVFFSVFFFFFCVQYIICRSFASNQH